MPSLSARGSAQAEAVHGARRKARQPGRPARARRDRRGSSIEVEGAAAELNQQADHRRGAGRACCGPRFGHGEHGQRAVSGQRARDRRARGPAPSARAITTRWCASRSRPPTASARSRARCSATRRRAWSRCSASRSRPISPGHMLYVVNEDAPGFIGRLGTLLGEAGVNIGTFHLGRRAGGRRGGAAAVGRRAGHAANCSPRSAALPGRARPRWRLQLLMPLPGTAHDRRAASPGLPRSPAARIADAAGRLEARVLDVARPMAMSASIRRWSNSRTRWRTGSTGGGTRDAVRFVDPVSQRTLAIRPTSPRRSGGSPRRGWRTTRARCG